MAKLWISLTVVAIMIGTKLASSHSSEPDTLEGREEFLAKGMNKMAPAPMGPDLTLTGAKVDEGVLEIELAQSTTGPKLIAEGLFKQGAVPTTCKDPIFSDLIRRGGSIRYAVNTSDGTVLSTATISSTDCPTT